MSNIDKNSSVEYFRSNNHSFYHIGGITISVEMDPPITSKIFGSKFEKFETNEVGEDDIILRHHFYIPNDDSFTTGKKIYHKSPWVVYKSEKNWIYIGIAPDPDDPSIDQIAIFNDNHTIANIYSEFDPNYSFDSGKVDSLTFFPTDQILLSRVLADRQGCIFHSAGMVIDGNGFLFAGHSGAGKSTIVTQLMPYGEILCDDRMIIRRWAEGFRIHGTWSHGIIPIISPGSAPLRAIFLLEQAGENRLMPVEDRKELARLFPFLIIKPLVTVDWWEKTFDMMEQLIDEIPVYRLRFDLSGQVIDVLRHFL